MAQYLNPLTDYGFKNLFGKEYSKEVLIDFLNELYSDLPGMETIVDLRYSDKEMTRITEEGKTVIYDIHCVTSTGHHLIVEMQVNSQSTFLSRAIYYLCRAISEQGEMGSDWQYNFDPVYGIYFTDFKMKNIPARVKSHSMICDLEDGKPLTNKVCLSFIQLELFDKPKEDCHTGFDQWIYVLKNLSTMDTMPFTEEKKIFAKVQDISDYHRLDPKERVEYDAALKRYRDYNVTLQTATQNGIEIGREEGREEGLAEASLAIAKKLKGIGLDFEKISDVTGLSITEIESL